MPTVKRVLAGVRFETAKRQRRCWRNREHEIRAGEKCLVVRQGMRKSNYCMACAAMVLEAARQELDTLIAEQRSWQPRAIQFSLTGR